MSLLGLTFHFTSLGVRRDSSYYIPLRSLDCKFYSSSNLLINNRRTDVINAFGFGSIFMFFHKRLNDKRDNDTESQTGVTSTSYLSTTTTVMT